MGKIASQITSLTIVYSTVYSDACFVTVFQNENNNGTANLIIVKNNIQCIAGTEKSTISFVFTIWDTFY